MFGSLWKNFESRFTGILENLARHRDLVDKEAISIDITESRSWRIKTEEDIERREKYRQEQQLHYTLNWLAVDDFLQEEELERLSDQREDGTCEWVMDRSPLTAWTTDEDREAVLWFHGIPGAGAISYLRISFIANGILGKSVLCSHVISSLRAARKSTTLYYFCNSYHGDRNLCATIFRTLILQLVRGNVDFASHISDDYIAKCLSCSMAQLKALLPTLLNATVSTRIIVDGLDECEDKQQRQVLQELLKLSGDRCKLLISSRDGGSISKILKKKRRIALGDCRADVDADIRLYTSQALTELRERFDSEIIIEINQSVAEKAGGA